MHPAGLATQVELSLLRGMVGLSRKPYDITLDMTLDDWVQAPYSGAVQEVSDGLHLQGSGYRIGNVIYTKKWFNMIGSTVFMKWKAGDSSYAGFSVGIMRFFDAVGFSTHHSFNGSTVINRDTWIYTTMRCDEDGECITKSATGNYADQDGAAVIREKTLTLTSFEQEQLSATRLYFTFGDNYNSDSTVQSGILGEAKIVDTIEVEKPKTSVSVYDGEPTIPTSFYVDDNGGGGTNCLWEIEEIDEENAIKGSSSSGNCLLALGINDARGISFSIKTSSPSRTMTMRFGYPHPANRSPSLLSTTGSSDWKTYWLPTVMFPTTLHWVVYGSSAMWVKDIKLWYGPSDQERLTELQDQLSLIQTEISDFQERLSELEDPVTTTATTIVSSQDCLPCWSDAGSLVEDNNGADIEATDVDWQTSYLQLKWCGGEIYYMIADIVSAVGSASREILIDHNSLVCSYLGSAGSFTDPQGCDAKRAFDTLKPFFDANQGGDGQPNTRVHCFNCASGSCFGAGCDAMFQ